MGHNQTWWLLREIRMMWKGISVLSILRWAILHQYCICLGWQ
jgi:hypothetical protein